MLLVESDKIELIENGKVVLELKLEKAISIQRNQVIKINEKYYEVVDFEESTKDGIEIIKLHVYKTEVIDINSHIGG